MMFANRWIPPIPKTTPVKNRRRLFDCMLYISWIPPSKTSGMRRKTQTRIGVINPSINNKQDTRYPVKMPVQRAHKGN